MSYPEIVACVKAFLAFAGRPTEEADQRKHYWHFQPPSLDTLEENQRFHRGSTSFAAAMASFIDWITPGKSNPLLTPGPALFDATAMDNSFISGKYSDMTITCPDYVFNVHRVIICTQSAFFTAEIDSEFMENTTNNVNLSANDAETIERVLSFLYCGDYEEDGHKLDVYIAADKYGIPDLKCLAAKRFAARWKKDCDIAEICGVVTVVMERCPQRDSTLRVILADTICKNFDSLTKDWRVMAVLREYGSHGCEVTARVSEKLQGGKRELELQVQEEKEAREFVVSKRLR
ncbi:hypothetical protein BJX99DRAFT_264831 [Aspergillus californicus]